MAGRPTDLSFDPQEPYFAVPGCEVEWTVEIFTTDNMRILPSSAAQAERELAGAMREEPDSTDAGGAASGGESARATAVRVQTLTTAGQQRHVDGGAELRCVQLAEDDWQWSMEVWSDEPIKAIKLRLRALPESMLATGVWSANSPRLGQAPSPLTETVHWDYPSQDWATPWFAVGSADDGYCLSVRDDIVSAKRMHAYVPAYSDGAIVELVLTPPAHQRARSWRAPMVHMRRYRNERDVRAHFEEHLSFVTTAYELRQWEQRPDRPGWLDDIDLVVSLHGQHWTGYVFNTFDQMADTLRWLSNHIDGSRTLAYLPGWEGRYYHDYPLYRPGPDLGGADGFRRLIDTARALGIRLMPMIGANGVNVRSYPAWRDAVMRCDTGEYLELINRPDWDSDRCGESDQVFASPGEPAFRAVLVDAIDRLASAGIDAVFLDTAGSWFDDPLHPFIDGYRALAAEVHAQHPDLLLAGEGWWDALMGVIPFSQQWLGVDRDIRFPQLVDRFIRTTDHLAIGEVGRGSTGVHEEGHIPWRPPVRVPGHVPVISFVDDTRKRASDEIAGMCAAVGRQGAGRVGGIPR